MTQTPSFRDVEKLSAYLDGQLKPSEVARLESRLRTEPQLASILKELRQARGVLRQLPQRRAPRNFTLTPKMVGRKPPLPRSYPVFRFATVLATLLLFFTLATNFVTPRLYRSAAPYPYGLGGGGGGEPELSMEAAPAIEEPAAEEAPLEEPAAPQMAAPAPTSTAAPAEDSARVAPTLGPSEKSGVQEPPPDETFAQQVPPEGPAEAQPPAPPISATWQLALAGIAILSGLVTFVLRYSAIRKWRAKAK